MQQMRLIMVTRDQSPRIEQTRLQLTDFLAQQPRVVLQTFRSTDDLALGDPLPDLVLVLGGDGTMLRTCRQLGSTQIPLLGVNLGRLGFLADLSPTEFFQQFPRLLAGDYRVVHHLMLSCQLVRRERIVEDHLALNEAAILSAGALQMLHIQLSVNDEHVTTYSCDGLMLSTPVGSTAHNLAAGGPILRQDLNAIAITPISPHTLTNRPLVDSAECVYKLSVPEIPSGAMLVVDGQIKRPLLPGDEVVIRKADVTFQLARLSSHSYYATLHRKLGWGGQPHYEEH